MNFSMSSAPYTGKATAGGRQPEADIEHFLNDILETFDGRGAMPS
jgi:hypothetical protein